MSIVPEGDFALLHETVDLTVDFGQRRLIGHVDMWVAPTVPYAETLCVNARQMKIQNVVWNGESLEFSQLSFANSVCEEGGFSLDAYSTAYCGALSESDQGELVITVPEAAIRPVSSTAAALQALPTLPGRRPPRRRAGQGGDGADEFASFGVDVALKLQFMPICVRIEYELLEPLGGAYFILPDAPDENGGEGAFAHREPHMFTESHHRLARCWMPSFDTLTDFCTWSIRLTTPPDCLAISVGDLRLHELAADELSKTFVYELALPTLAADIAFAVGPFVPLADPARPGTVTHFCLPRHRGLLRESVSFLAASFTAMEDYLRVPMPYGSYKQVFVDDAYREASPHASLTIASAELLHTDAHVEVAMRARRLLVKAAATQYFGCLLVANTWCDLWLTRGWASHVADVAFARMFGKNDVRARIDELRHVAFPNTILPNGEIDAPLPLYCAGRIDAVELLDDKVWQARATLAMHMIHGTLGKDAMKKCLGGLFLNSHNTLTAHPPRRNWDTAGFTTLIKRLTGHDIRALAAVYVFGRGDAPMTVGFAFNKRQRQFEFAFRLHVKGMLRKDADVLLDLPQPLTVRVVETDGIYDHQVVLSELDTISSIPWYSRQRNTNRYRKRDVPMLQDAAMAAAATKARKGHSAAADGLLNVPPFPTFQGSGPIAGGEEEEEPEAIPGKKLSAEEAAAAAKKKKATQRARFANDPTVDKYTGIPLTSSVDVPVQWIHLDPNMQHMGPLTQRQPLSMWLAMLQFSGDVQAQTLAVRALDASESVPMQALVHTLYNPAVFWKVRVAAAKQLRNGAGSREAGSDPNWRPLEELLEFYKARHYADGLRPQALEFRDMAEYLVQKAIPTLVASVRDEKGLSPPDAVGFVVELLKQYDNTRNDRNDAPFLATLLNAAGLLRLPRPEAPDAPADVLHLGRELAAQVERFFARERFLPSHLNLVGASALRVRGVLAETGYFDVQAIATEAESLLAYGNHPHVRLAAFDVLLRLSNENGSALIYMERLLDVFQEGSSESRFRAQVLKALMNNDVGHDFTEEVYGDHRERVDKRLAALQVHSAGSERFAMTLWTWMNDAHSAYDPRVRALMWQLYERAFGTGTPRPLLMMLADDPVVGHPRLYGRALKAERERRLKARPKPPRGGALISTAATAMQISVPADIAHEKSSFSLASNGKATLARSRKIGDKDKAPRKVPKKKKLKGEEEEVLPDLVVPDGVVDVPPPVEEEEEVASEIEEDEDEEEEEEDAKMFDETDEEGDDDVDDKLEAAQRKAAAAVAAAEAESKARLAAAGITIPTQL